MVGSIELPASVMSQLPDILSHFWAVMNLWQAIMNLPHVSIMLRSISMWHDELDLGWNGQPRPMMSQQPRCVESATASDESTQAWHESGIGTN